jgi:hypothetical protein
VRGRGGFPVGGGVGQALLLGRQPFVLVGVLELRGVELVDLEAQEVELAGPGSLIAAEPSQPLVDAP